MHALILLNATAAGFQSLDPQDPPSTSSSSLSSRHGCFVHQEGRALGGPHHRRTH